ncbi:uncharacterized protein LOC126622443 isoform X1 [Malus sylvestris]|uniref:uncharacterized protein LOC126622443 isoform X1 n=1 Tax=Malus sylvestris TaxID=3752 RepID=UPI0021AC26F5|nr:uncharacterized protein LOC126622443 isoform X1 [Malus sylvestris]
MGRGSYFISGLLIFPKSHPEDYEIPEETLPQPFGPTKQDMQSDTDKLPLSSSQGDEISDTVKLPLSSSQVGCSFSKTVNGERFFNVLEHGVIPYVSLYKWHLSCYCIWSFPTPRHIFYRLHALCAYIRCLFVAPCMLVMWPSFDVILADLVSVVIPLLELKKATKDGWGCRGSEGLSTEVSSMQHQQLPFPPEPIVPSATKRRGFNSQSLVL